MSEKTRLREFEVNRSRECHCTVPKILNAQDDPLGQWNIINIEWKRCTTPFIKQPFLVSLNSNAPFSFNADQLRLSEPEIPTSEGWS